MNARQKAKYYKRKFFILANIPLPQCKIEAHKIDTVRCERRYPYPEALGPNNDFITDVIKRDITWDLANQILQHAKYTAEFNPLDKWCKVTAEINVVNPEDK